MTQFASTLYPQTNPTNPILLTLRGIQPPDRSWWLIGFLRAVHGGANFLTWSESEIDHAARVLTRLASLSG